MKKFFLLLLLLLISTTVYSEDIEAPSLAVNSATELESLSFDKVFEKITREEAAPVTDVASATGSIRFTRVKNEFYYVIILSALCLVSLSIVLYFMLKLKQDARPKDMVSSSGLIIIVFGTIILVLIVDTSEQLTAAIGILGAIAGYLFRTAQENNQESSAERE